LQPTVAGLLPVQSAGVDESEQEEAFEDEKLMRTDPPLDGRLLGVRERVAVGAAVAVAGAAAADAVAVAGLLAAPSRTTTARCAHRGRAPRARTA
jgi:hypothetical protein